MAKKFLYFIAFCIVCILLAGIAWQLFSSEITRAAFVPSAEFVEQEPLEQNAYEDPALWISRPGMGVSDPARWQPAYSNDRALLPSPAEQSPGDFAVFFVHPSSFIDRGRWNAPMSAEADDEADRIARIYVRGMASPFNTASQIWAPRYRQATMGAFLTDKPEAQSAIDAAYADVREAYRYFVESLDADTPIVLAGHSQGSLHILRLLREEVKASPVADRLVAVYAVGWPISVQHDLPELGIPACATPDQTGCLISWSSFAEPADPSDLLETYANSTGFDGEQRGQSQILCTNPITGTFAGEAPAEENLGTLVPDATMANGELVPQAVPARCDGRGILLIGDPPELGSYVLPGNNYHVYDIPLFWANTQFDAVRRVDAKVRGTSQASTAQSSAAQGTAP